MAPRLSHDVTNDQRQTYCMPRGFGAAAPDGTSAFGELGFTFALVPSFIVPVSGALIPEPVVPLIAP